VRLTGKIASKHRGKLIHPFSNFDAKSDHKRQEIRCQKINWNMQDFSAEAGKCPVYHSIFHFYCQEWLLWGSIHWLWV